MEIIDELYQLILQRKAHLPDGSYTAHLFKKGKQEILKKVGEECIEVIVASSANDRKATVYELADLWYHLLVLMAIEGITPGDVTDELTDRFKK